MTWHTGLQCRVKWDGVFSDWFHITAGVRQGGVLSPDLYCLYVDELISILQSMRVGCYVRNIFAAAFFYADDMAVLAPSLKGLQRLLDACASYCSEWDIKLNTKKKQKHLLWQREDANALCSPKRLCHSLGRKVRLSQSDTEKWCNLWLLHERNS